MSQEIELYRPYLFTVAYNILGEVQEAEDLVQEAFAYYLSLDQGYVQNIKSYLTRVVANKAIDRLKELKKQRENYVGPWLPEPFVHENADLDSSAYDIMSYEVLSALEILNPVERAVFVLREAFNYPFSELAVICDTSEANCRKILSRTRQKISVSQNHQKPEPKQQLISLMQSFLQAVAKEDTSSLENLLKEDIVLYSDGGGKVAAAINPLYGRAIVSKFLIGLAKKNKNRSLSVSIIEINNQPAILLSNPQGPESITTFGMDGDNLSKIFIIRNPDKIFPKRLSQKQ